MIEIKNVIENSTADKIGIKAGDKIISINGKKIKDYIDYNFEVADLNFTIKIKDSNDEIKEYTVKRKYNEKLGIEFNEIVFNGLNQCKNKCIFCFVDQQPPDLRDTLNMKDDDYRFSFLQGSYITLTNLSENDFDRIVKYNLSPINISVHTTDPELRKYMMKNPKAGNILKQLDFLKENGINFNTQLVLCPGINDKEKLNESIKDLSNYYPNILSLAVVPVGLTKYKNENLRTYTKKEAKSVIEQIKKWQETLQEKFAENFLYASDEFYLITDTKIPDYDHYNDFPQLENGVGLTRLFREKYKNLKDKYIEILKNEDINKNIYTIITSVLGRKAIQPVIDDINQRQNSIKIEIEVVRNDFFGKTVTVTGLLTAEDIEKKLKSIDSDNVILPAVLLNDNNKFIDEVNIVEFKKKFDDKKIYVCNDIKDIMEVLVDVKTSGSNSR